MADFDPLFVELTAMFYQNHYVFLVFSVTAAYTIIFECTIPIPTPTPPHPWMVYVIQIVDCFGEQAIHLTYVSIHLFLSRCLQVTTHLKKQLKHTSKEPEENRNLCLCIPRRVKLELLSICLVDMYVNARHRNTTLYPIVYNVAELCVLRRALDPACFVVLWWVVKKVSDKHICDVIWKPATWSNLSF